MSIRKLVTVRKVLEIIPIEGADLIELARIDGWKSVVKKGDFKVGDYGVYFEIDSFLPITDNRFQFLKKNCLKTMLIEGIGPIKGFRLRTIELRKQISQGLLMPLSLFPEIDLTSDIGKDLSDKLRVIKYEAPVPSELYDDVLGEIPINIQKTDQERIQNLLHYFEIYKDIEFEETEKEDGTSSTMYFYDNHFGVCGHKWEFKKSLNQTMWKLAEKHNVEKVMRSINRQVAIQGETVGEGIQKNTMVLKGHHFHIFDIYDIEKSRYMTPDERYNYIDIANIITETPLVHVPVINRSVKIFNICKNIDEILEYAKGDTRYCKGHRREGLVFKSVELIDGRNITFKVIDNIKLSKEKD